VSFLEVRAGRTAGRPARQCSGLLLVAFIALAFFGNSFGVLSDVLSKGASDIDFHCKVTFFVAPHVPLIARMRSINSVSAPPFCVRPWKILSHTRGLENRGILQRKHCAMCCDAAGFKTESSLFTKMIVRPYFRVQSQEQRNLPHPSADSGPSAGSNWNRSCRATRNSRTHNDRRDGNATGKAGLGRACSSAGPMKPSPLSYNTRRLNALMDVNFKPERSAMCLESI
jgi:hypothetical protein